MLKKILYFLVALLLIIGIGTLILFNLPAENVSKKTVDFTVSASSLFSEFENDEKAGNAKYIDKVLIVEGTVEDVTTDEKGATVILLLGNDMGGGVLCTLDAEKNDSKPSLGDQVKIKGRCTGMLIDVVLNKCTIIKE